MYTFSRLDSAFNALRDTQRLIVKEALVSGVMLKPACFAKISLASGNNSARARIGDSSSRNAVNFSIRVHYKTLSRRRDVHQQSRSRRSYSVTTGSSTTTTPTTREKSDRIVSARAARLRGGAATSPLVSLEPGTSSRGRWRRCATCAATVSAYAPVPLSASLVKKDSGGRAARYFKFFRGFLSFS